MSKAKKVPPNPKELDLLKNLAGILAFDDASGNSYEVRADGVYRKESKPNSMFIKLCAALELVAHTRNNEGDDWGIWIRFKDADTQPHELILSRKLFSQGKKVEELLSSAGLHVPILSGNTGRCPLAEFFNAVPWSLPRALTVSQGGFASDKYDSFVFGEDVVLSLEGAERVKALTSDCAAALTVKGTLEKWQANVSAPALHSNRLMFGLCVGFAAPLLQILGLPCVTFHLNGTSGDGKSSILKAVASIYGGEDRVTGWDKTKNGFEAVAARYNNQPLIIDEIGQSDADALDKIAYQLNNGVGRDRMTRNATLRKAARWSLIALSAGEFSLDETRRQKSRDGRSNTATGERVRFICIPCDAGKGLGVLDSLPEGVSEDAEENDARRVALLARVSSFAATGVAGREYLMRLMQDIADNGQDALKEQYRKIEERFLHDAGGNGLAPTERRVIRHFAAVALAGELAASYGILDGWEEQAAYKAVLACFNAWRESEDSPERHKDKVLESILNAPSRYRSEYLKFVLYPNGECNKFCEEFRCEVAGTVVLRQAGNFSTWIAAIYNNDQFDKLLRKVGENESKADMVAKLIKEERLLKRKNRIGNFLDDYEKDRKGQIQPKPNNVLELPTTSRVYVVLANADDKTMREVDRLLRSAR